MNLYWQAVFAGFTNALTLICAIGAQNAFVLKQGLKKEHVFAVCATCIVLDAVLMAVGVGGFHMMVQRWPWVMPVARYGGAIFLLWYGWNNAMSAWRGTATLRVSGDAVSTPLGRTVLSCFLLSVLNPHVYLDTVVLIGTLSARYGALSWYFWIGSATASLVFFLTLGYGARFLRPILATPRAWRILDGSIAVIMWSIAISLLRFSP